MLDPTDFQYFNVVVDIFRNKSQQDIEEVVDTVLREIPDDSAEVQLESIINLLSEPSEGSLAPAVPQWGHNGLQYLNEMLNIFPDACPTYVRKLCENSNNTDLDDLLDKMVGVDYPKNMPDPQQVFQQLKEMLPNADPAFLRKQANCLAFQPPADLKKFVEDSIENNDYPTLADYVKNKKLQDEVDQYTHNFNIQNFLERFPDPEKHFSNPNRKHSLMVNTTAEQHENEDVLYALTFLYNLYGYLRKKDIQKAFEQNLKNLLTTCSKLDYMRKFLIVPRKVISTDRHSTNIELLQEIAYIKHRKQINRVLKQNDLHYRSLKEQAKLHGLIETCQCCFDDELIPEECYFCKNGCVFCKECVKKGAETVIGDGKLDFLCLANCGSEYSISTLQMVLDSVVFARMAQRKQMEEVKQAALDGLETCPFCEFSTIPSPEDKIFHCLNSDCLKESCRECRHEAHIPLRCSEIEYDEDVRMRTYIENKMTEALLRKCWKCSKVFIKESGCNKMTCSCGAAMCYVCGAAVKDYVHFSNSSGKCPLYTDDLNKFHRDAVVRGANAAKVDLGVDRNPKILKNDPSAGM